LKTWQGTVETQKNEKVKSMESWQRTVTSFFLARKSEMEALAGNSLNSLLSASKI
jgi:hypothetical protein